MCFSLCLCTSVETIAQSIQCAITEPLPSVPGEISAFTHPTLPVVVAPRNLQAMHWGLVPSWISSQEEARTIRQKTLNARAETITQLPSFRDCYQRHQRCIIPADSFFEYQHQGKNQKTRYRIDPTDQPFFLLGGLWSSWIGPKSGMPFLSFTIITVPANPLLEIIHNTKKRMPLILDPHSIDQWLTGNDSLPLLQPFPESRISATALIENHADKEPHLDL